jgi:uncharacterized surface protein with fasciclin (FAS1) repeats
MAQRARTGIPDRPRRSSGQRGCEGFAPNDDQRPHALQGFAECPFTVFAPTNEAFAQLPKGTVENLLKPENKDKLVKILTYHVVSADAMANTIKKMIKDDGGKHTVTTVSGGKLVAMMKGDKIELMDENGGIATVTIANVKQSNDVIHVVDHVLLPK